MLITKCPRFEFSENIKYFFMLRYGGNGNGNGICRYVKSSSSPIPISH